MKFIKSDTSVLINKKINRLTIIEDRGVVKEDTRVLAICQCGVIKEYRLADILNENTRSCGCLRREMMNWGSRLDKKKSIKSNKTHGLSNHPIYRSWARMLGRCYSPSGSKKKNYGGRGVAVCDEWRNSFESFYRWAIDKWKPGLHLDKDILAPKIPGTLYCPEYCSFVTPRENNENRRNSIKINYQGNSFSIRKWSELSGIKYCTIVERIKSGWPPEKAVSVPTKARKNVN